MIQKIKLTQLNPLFYIGAVTFLVGFVFIVWDVYFTKWGYWGFSDQYITGLSLFSLPIEEVLFFFCIPYACVFSFHVLETIFPINDSPAFKKINYLLSFTLLCLGLVFLEKYYTSITFISLSVVLLIAPMFIYIKLFYRAWAFCLFPF